MPFEHYFNGSECICFCHSFTRVFHFFQFCHKFFLFCIHYLLSVDEGALFLFIRFCCLGFEGSQTSQFILVFYQFDAKLLKVLVCHCLIFLVPLQFHLLISSLFLKLCNFVV